MDKHAALKQLAEELLEKLEISATVEIQDKDSALWVTIGSPESGILIGRHGRNLEAVQVLLGQMLYKKTGAWERVIVSVGDYREKRNLQLQELAESAAAKVVQNQEPVVLSDLTPAERRIIHMHLAQHQEVTSESEGEGRFRHLIVKLKK